MALYLTEEDVSRLVNMDTAIEAVEEAFRHQANGLATNSPRERLRLSNGHFNLMTAAAPGLGVMGLKAYAGGGFHVHLTSSETGELLAIIEAAALGRLRTGAASGVAARLLSHEDSATLGLIGTGRQALPQAEAVLRVRPIGRVVVYSRDPERRRAFASGAARALGVEVEAAGSAEACVAEADVLAVITNSAEPVVRGEWLRPGVHVNAAGANSWTRRELDDEAVRRADVIVVDDLAQARAECADLMHAVETGATRWERVSPLCDALAGRSPGRERPEDVTLFESQGVALEDIALGLRAYRLAERQGVGRRLPFA